MREQLLSVQRQTGITPKDLEVPDCPQSMVSILNIFYELSSARQSGMSLNPIAWGDIMAYCSLTETRLEKWEIDTIRALDRIFLEVFAPKDSE